MAVYVLTRCPVWGNRPPPPFLPFCCPPSRSCCRNHASYALLLFAVCGVHAPCVRRAWPLRGATSLGLMIIVNDVIRGVLVQQPSAVDQRASLARGRMSAAGSVLPGMVAGQRRSTFEPQQTQRRAESSQVALQAASSQVALQWSASSNTDESQGG